MFQPFVKFEQQHLDRLIFLQNNYLVSQIYHRVDHLMDQGLTFLLFTDYKDLGLANIHYKAVRHDKYACIIDLSNDAHLYKIKEMMHGNLYAIYWSVVPNAAALRKRLNASYKSKIQKYLLRKTSWLVTRDEPVNTQLEVIFGELFLHLRWRRERLRIKFAEIEKY